MTTSISRSTTIIAKPERDTRKNREAFQKFLRGLYSKYPIRDRQTWAKYEKATADRKRTWRSIAVSEKLLSGSADHILYMAAGTDLPEDELLAVYMLIFG